MPETGMQRALAGLPAFDVGIYGSVAKATAAAVAAGGGVINIPNGTWSLGSGANGISIDGTVPLVFRGVAPTGYDHGTILTYGGAGFAFKSTATQYPNIDGKGAYTVFQDLTIQMQGTAWTAGGGIDAHYLPVQFRGHVNVFGNASTNVTGSLGIYLGPSANQMWCSGEIISIFNFDDGMFLASDHFTCQILEFYQCGSWSLQYGTSEPTTIDMLLIATLAPITGAFAIRTGQPTVARINNLHWEGTGMESVMHFFSGSAGPPIPSIGDAQINNTPVGFALIKGVQIAPIFEHLTGWSGEGIGWGFATPGLPAGTGSGNAVQNVSGTACDVYLDATANGVHIIDWQGNDVALPSAAAGVERMVRLQNGDSIYFATAIPLAWAWYRT